MPSQTNAPVAIKERSEILDILRGIALLGICLANYAGISMFIFQKPEVKAAMPTATIDKVLDYFHFIFIDGKFYSLFSLLFGIGFSIILLRCREKNKSFFIFYRRLFILAIIGLAHLLLFWEGDILLLYALLGLLLPLFRNVSDKNLLLLFVFLIFSPLIFDALKVVSNNEWNLSTPVKNVALAIDAKHGITDDNFADWKINRDDWKSLLQYNEAGVFWRYQSLLDNNRLPKVMGVFLLGLYVGRKMLYRKLQENVVLLKTVQRWGFIIGLPASVAYAVLEMDSQKLPSPFALLDTLSYALSVVPLSLAYTTTICLLYLKPPANKKLKIFAAPGRMALTNYLLQTVIAVIIFYGIGFGLGGSNLGALHVFLIALAVYFFEIFFSHFWLKYFQYGPMEWLWRQLTYGKRLPLKKEILKIQ